MEKQIAIKRKKRRTTTKREIVSKGIYENGEIKLSGKRLPKKKMNVVVTFREEETNKKHNKLDTVNDFVKKWSGVIKAKDLDLVMEKKLDYLVEKHK